MILEASDANDENLDVERILSRHQKTAGAVGKSEPEPAPEPKADTNSNSDFVCMRPLVRFHSDSDLVFYTVFLLAYPVIFTFSLP